MNDKVRSALSGLTIGLSTIVAAPALAAPLSVSERDVSGAFVDGGLGCVEVDGEVGRAESSRMRDVVCSSPKSDTPLS